MSSDDDTEAALAETLGAHRLAYLRLIDGSPARREASRVEEDRRVALEEDRRIALAAPDALAAMREQAARRASLEARQAAARSLASLSAKEAALCARLKLDPAVYVATRDAIKRAR